ncbi:MAG: cupin domain-containing protein [Candidatus Poribacteria bacterium]|nr:cupin domain-containing protein [Candidatus Poribacteria bacterium]MDE0502434.1 cupin domain-containing protein [Candidatus Poribacteria bacterium]
MNTSFERPYKPVDLNTSVTQGFPLPSLAEKLMTEATSNASGRSSLTLARGDELTVVLAALKSGHALDEHPAPAAASVTCLYGNITFTSRAEEVTLERGETVVFTADILHSVHAIVDSVFLIVIGGAAAKNS